MCVGVNGAFNTLSDNSNISSELYIIILYGILFELPLVVFFRYKFRLELEIQR